MIIMSNHSDDYQENLASELRRKSRVMSSEKLFNTKESFKREALLKSNHGYDSMTYILYQKPNETYLTDDFIKQFKHFIIHECGLNLDYEYVTEVIEDKAIKFHKFSVSW